MAEDFSQIQSKYNEAMLQIQRLHESWTKCNNFARSGQFQAWRWELDIIWRELESDIKKLSNKKKEQLLKLFQSYDTKDIKGLNQTLKTNITESKRYKIYEKIDERHIFLKELQDAVGKGAIFQDNSEDGM